MSKRIAQILDVIGILRARHRHGMSIGHVPDSRREVVDRVARSFGVDATTISDKFRRQLHPDIIGTNEFDQAVSEWLSHGDPRLQRALLKHSVGARDETRVREFFCEPARHADRGRDDGEPPFAERIQTELGIDPNLVLEFLLTFARFEYALKRIPRYRRVDRRTRRVSPNWSEYCEAQANRFDPSSDQELHQAYHYLDRYRPGVQSADPLGMLYWEAPPRGKKTDLEWVLSLVRNVRNNLFHGGKYPSPTAPLEDAGADRHLLDASLTILRAAAELSDDFWNLYTEFARGDHSPLLRRGKTDE